MMNIKKTPKRAIDYILNPNKLGEANLTYTHHVNQEIADLEFSLIRDENIKKTPRILMASKENLAYHIVQSHRVGDKITPELALEIAKKTIEKFTCNDYAYVMAVHTDEAHLHVHTVVNAYSHTGKKKLENHRGYERLYEISKPICLAHGLTVAELNFSKNKAEPKVYSKKNDSKYPKTATENLKDMIDLFVRQSNSYDEFLKMFEQVNVKVETRRTGGTDSLAFLMPNSKKFKKLSALKEGYSLTQIKERITNEKFERGVDETLTNERVLDQTKELTLQHPNKPVKGFKYYSDEYWRGRREDFKSIDTHGDVLSLINRYGFTSSREVQNLIDECLQNQSIIKAKTTQLEVKYDWLIETYKKSSTSLEEKETIKDQIPSIREKIKPLNDEFKANTNEMKQFEAVKERFLKQEQKNQRRR